MTKKHFEALAASLKSNQVQPIAGWENVACQWRADVLVIADVCAQFNPHFDRARFLKACGVGE